MSAVCRSFIPLTYLIAYIDVCCFTSVFIDNTVRYCQKSYDTVGVVCTVNLYISLFLSVVTVVTVIIFTSIKRCKLNHVEKKIYANINFNPSRIT